MRLEMKGRWWIQLNPKRLLRLLNSTVFISNLFSPLIITGTLYFPLPFNSYIGVSFFSHSVDYYANRDHAGGNEKIKELVTGIKVYGGSVDNVKGCTHKVDNGDKISLGDNITILSLHTPWYML